MLLIALPMLGIVLACSACLACLLWKGRPKVRARKPGPRAVTGDEPIKYAGLVKKLAAEGDVDDNLARVLRQRLELAEEMRRTEQWALDDALFQEESDAIRRLSSARAEQQAPAARKRRPTPVPAKNPPKRQPPPDADHIDFEIAEAEMERLNSMSIERTQSIEARRAKREGKQPVSRSPE